MSCSDLKALLKCVKVPDPCDMETLDTSAFVRRSDRNRDIPMINREDVKILLRDISKNAKSTVVFKLKDHIQSAISPNVFSEILAAFAKSNKVCQAMYIQNMDGAIQDEQMDQLIALLKIKTKIWAMNIGETYEVSKQGWVKFCNALPSTNITHLYVSEHIIPIELKNKMRDHIRENRKKHKLHSSPKNIGVIEKVTHMWWNPINSLRHQKTNDETIGKNDRKKRQGNDKEVAKIGKDTPAKKKKTIVSKSAEKEKESEKPKQAEAKSASKKIPVTPNKTKRAVPKGSNKKQDVRANPNSTAYWAKGKGGKGSQTPWKFHCICGEQCSSNEHESVHPTGNMFECTSCHLWSHTSCVFGKNAPNIEKDDQVLCGKCKSINRRKELMMLKAFAYDDVDVEMPELTRGESPNELRRNVPSPVSPVVPIEEALGSGSASNPSLLPQKQMGAHKEEDPQNESHAGHESKFVPINQATLKPSSAPSTSSNTLKTGDIPPSASVPEPLSGLSSGKPSFPVPEPVPVPIATSPVARKPTNSSGGVNGGEPSLLPTTTDHLNTDKSAPAKKASFLDFSSSSHSSMPLPGSSDSPMLLQAGNLCPIQDWISIITPSNVDLLRQPPSAALTETVSEAKGKGSKLPTSQSPRGQKATNTANNSTAQSSRASSATDTSAKSGTAAPQNLSRQSSEKPKKPNTSATQVKLNGNAPQSRAIDERLKVSPVREMHISTGNQEKKPLQQLETSPLSKQVKADHVKVTSAATKPPTATATATVTANGNSNVNHNSSNGTSCNGQSNVNTSSAVNGSLATSQSLKPKPSLPSRVSSTAKPPPVKAVGSPRASSKSSGQRLPGGSPKSSSLKRAPVKKTAAQSPQTSEMTTILINSTRMSYDMKKSGVLNPASKVVHREKTAPSDPKKDPDKPVLKLSFPSKVKTEPGAGALKTEGSLRGRSMTTGDLEAKGKSKLKPPQKSKVPRMSHMSSLSNKLDPSSQSMTSLSTLSGGQSPTKRPRRSSKGFMFVMRSRVYVPGERKFGTIVEEKNGGWKYVLFDAQESSSSSTSSSSKSTSPSYESDASLASSKSSSSAPPVPSLHTSSSESSVAALLSSMSVISPRAKSSARGEIKGKWCRACDMREVGEGDVPIPNKADKMMNRSVSQPLSSSSATGSLPGDSYGLDFTADDEQDDLMVLGSRVAYHNPVVTQKNTMLNAKRKRCESLDTGLRGMQHFFDYAIHMNDNLSTINIGSCASTEEATLDEDDWKLDMSGFGSSFLDEDVDFSAL